MTGLFDAILGVWTKSESRPAAPVPEKRQETMNQVDAEDGSAVDSTCLPAVATANADAAIPHDISSLSLEPEDVLPVIMSPIRSNNTSASFTTSTLDTSASLSTPGVDISFGPQSLPFPIRRRIPFHEANSPSRVPFNSPQSMLSHRPRSVAITIRHPDDSIEETSEVIENGLPATAWRLDQIKYMRKARMSRDDTVRPIPTLNGPLSLPYARNPSGVDATVPDDSLTYLTHVFGLRGDPHVKLHPQESFQVKSDGSTRMAPSSELHGHAVFNGAIDVGSQGRPLVVREPHQAPSLRRNTAVNAEAAKVQEVVDTAKTFSRLPAKETESDIAATQAAEPTVSVVPVSIILRAQAKPTDPSPTPLGTASSAEADPFNGLFDQALASAARPQNAASDMPHSRRVSDPVKPTYADLKSIWQASGQFYGRIAAAEGEGAESPARRAVSDDTTATGFASAAFSTPIKLPPTPSALGKADKSINWRNKPITTPGGREIPSIAVTSPTIEANSTVMTIDALFDRFHVVDDKPSSSSASAANVADPAIKETSATPMRAKSKGPSPIRGPLGESKGIVVNSALKKVPAGTHKGTPNAGKLLKKKVEITVPKDLPTKGKGKGKAVG